MKEKMEIISLNTTKVEFEEELNLDARLQRLESNELKLIRAGETCVRMDCTSLRLSVHVGMLIGL